MSFEDKAYSSFIPDETVENLEPSIAEEAPMLTIAAMGSADEITPPNDTALATEYIPGSNRMKAYKLYTIW